MSYACDFSKSTGSLADVSSHFFVEIFTGQLSGYVLDAPGSIGYLYIMQGAGDKECNVLLDMANLNSACLNIKLPTSLKVFDFLQVAYGTYLSQHPTEGAEMWDTKTFLQQVHSLSLERSKAVTVNAKAS